MEHYIVFITNKKWISSHSNLTSRFLFLIFKIVNITSHNNWAYQRQTKIAVIIYAINLSWKYISDYRLSRTHSFCQVITGSCIIASIVFHVHSFRSWNTSSNGSIVQHSTRHDNLRYGARLKLESTSRLVKASAFHKCVLTICGNVSLLITRH